MPLGWRAKSSTWAEAQVDGAFVGPALHEREGALDVLVAVERLEGGAALGDAAAVDDLDVVSGDEGAVAEHRVAEVARGLGGVDGAAPACADEGGEVAAVVDVRVREEDAVDRPGVHHQPPVALEGLLAVALVQAAVEQDAQAVHVHDVHRAGGRVRRPLESDRIHAASPFFPYFSKPARPGQARGVGRLPAAARGKGAGKGAACGRAPVLRRGGACQVSPGRAPSPRRRVFSFPLAVLAAEG